MSLAKGLRVKDLGGQHTRFGIQLWAKGRWFWVDGVPYPKGICDT